MFAPTTPLRRLASSWLAPASAPGRGGALDGLRFLASMLIVLFHFAAEGPMKLWYFSDAFARGYLATDFFLMLSGYVLGRAYGPAIVSGRVGPLLFWLRRATRIWPGHLIVLVGFVAFVLGMTLLFGKPYNPLQFPWPSLGLQALLIHAWGIPSDGWNLPTWSLSALTVCYALFPWMWKGLARVKIAWLTALLGLLLLAGFDAFTQARYQHAIYDLPFQFGLVRALPLFVLGAGLARAVELDWPPEPVARWLFWGGMAVFVILLLPPQRHDLLAVLCLVAVILGGGRLPVRRTWRWAEEGAKISFALFITHSLFGAVYWMLVHNLIFHVKLALEIQWTLWLASFPLTIAVAWAFHVYIDQPIQRALAPHLRRREAAPAEVAP